MKDENIFEIARQHGSIGAVRYVSDDPSQTIFEFCYRPEKLIDFARALIEAERERIKSRVKEAAENSWCIKNEVVEDVEGELKRVPYSLYIGPSLNMLEEFVDKLLEVGK